MWWKVRIGSVLLGGLLICVLAGCADPGTSPPPASPGGDAAARAEFDERAAQVADAWTGSYAAGAWGDGFVPLENLTILPEDGWSEATKQAAFAGWYRTDIELDSGRPDAGEIAFDDGGTVSVPLVSAAEAWEAIHQGEPDCPTVFLSPDPTPSPGPDTSTSDRPVPCVVLTVTGVEPGTVTIRTSRGPAQAPAWLFRVAELGEAVARVAVAPAAIAEVPRPAMPEFPYQRGLATAIDLVASGGTELTYRVGIGACDEAPKPLVYETAEVVVVGGTVQTRPGVTACTDQLLVEPVTVTLEAPLDGRPVLSLTGEPLTIGLIG